ncbi:hypothetical protein ACI2LM_13360 [Paenibacillus lautus]|uniref:hypothetical protein n=1 Tax=Paenibacillus lautus TaxID=1401 RepID=UPI003850634D
MTQIQTVSDRIQTRKLSFLRNRVMYTKYIPIILINGKHAYVADESTPSGLMECDTREEARNKAREYRDHAKARIAVKEE